MAYSVLDGALYYPYSLTQAFYMRKIKYIWSIRN